MIQMIASNNKTSSKQILQNMVKKCEEANTNSYKFYEKNEDWIMSEIGQYLETNQKELDQKREDEENIHINDVKNYLNQQQ